MARKPYETDQSIKSMSTRQLRQYIADQADEAQKRLDTKPKDATKAFNELMYPITNRERTKIKRSTSYMTKAEMQEYAYDLRRFNQYDVESKYANRTEYQKNKKRYEKFIKNQIELSGKENQYWKQFLTPKGNVSKRGYQEYLDFIAVIRASEDYIKEFGYRNLQQYAQEQHNELDPGNKILNRTIAKVHAEYKGKGLTQAQLLDKLRLAYDDALEKQTVKKPKPKKSSTPQIKKARKQRSKNTNVKVKTTGKMRSSGAVHNKLT